MKRSRQQAGFTLVETGVAILIMSLLFLGGMNLFSTASRVSMTTNAKIAAQLDASIAIQRLADEMREARWVALPGETGVRPFRPVPGYSGTSSYQATVNGQTVATAITITFPARTTASTVVQTGGGAEILSGSSAVYDRKTNGDQLTIYRANADGAPNGSSGKHLRVYRWSGTRSTRPLLQTLAQTAPALQFVRPLDTSGTPIPHQLELKIVSAAATLEGTFTSESSRGDLVSSLTTKCVYLRNR